MSGLPQSECGDVGGALGSWSQTSSGSPHNQRLMVLAFIPFLRSSWVLSGIVLGQRALTGGTGC